MVIEGTPTRFIGDRYHIVRELGRGGMGVVYLGRDLRLDMDVAIKFRGLVHAEATLWLKREFRAVASLRHRNLVELYELVAHERSCYFTMEYLHGQDPREWVDLTRSALAGDTITRTTPPLERARTEVGDRPSDAPATRTLPNADFGRVRSVIAQLAEGLAFLHQRGVIHRDVKPSNAIIVDGTVKLLDFGLALDRKRQDDELARENRIVGTTAYLAPEYLSRLIVSPAMDVYALGVVAYELCTGAPPFGGTMHLLARLHKSFAVPRPSSVNPAVPPDLDAIIGAMLVAEPEARPAAIDVVERLTGQLSQPNRARELRFFGRGDELDRIRAKLNDPAPRGRLVLVTGPSGVGKTALLDEALSRALGKLSWRSKCHERERVPYRAFDQIVDDLAAELATDPGLATNLEHPGALGRMFPALAVPFTDDPVAGDLRVEKERALLGMIQLLARIVRNAQAVVVIDDLQWADGDSLELLALLIEKIGKPVTVIASWTTDGPVPPALAALAADTIAVTAMTDDDLAQLIGDLAPLASEVQLLAAARLAAGSPYLAELIGRELASANVADPEAAESRRLDRLAPPERQVAELAALAGGASTFEQLRSLAGLRSGQLHSILRSLEAERIVRATPSASGDAEYVFYHQRLRDAALGAMTDESRRASHERFAVWFEAKRGTADQLAYHWHHAGSPAKAAHWAERAGDDARALLAWTLAAHWYERALAYVDRADLRAKLPPSRAGGEDVDRRIRAKLGDSYFLGGKLAAAAAEFERLDGDAFRVRAAEAYLKLGEIDRGLGVLDGVLERRGERRSHSRALSIVRAAAVGARWLAPLPSRRRAVDDVLAQSYRVIASFLSTPQPIEALEYVLRGVDLAERTGDRAGHAQGMAMLAAYLAAGTLGKLGDRAIHTAQRLAAGEPYAEMVVAGSAGILEMLRGDWRAMRASHEAGEAHCRRLGMERSWEASFLRSYWALGEFYAGDPEKALALLGDLATTAEDMWSRAMIGSYRGRALVLAGDLGAARALLDGGTLARKGMAAFYHSLFAAELALAEHAWGAAAGQAEELERSARRQWLSAMPAVSAMIDVVHATAAIGLAAGGDRDAARRAVTTAKRIYRRGNASFYAPTALRLRAQAEALLGHPRAADALLARASEAAAKRGGRIEQLAIAGLRGEPIAPGPLAAAVAWSTGGVLS